MSQTGSNHCSSLAEETWVELGRMMRRSGSIESERVEPLVKQGRVGK